MMNITKDKRLLKRNINAYDTSTSITLCDWRHYCYFVMIYVVGAFWRFTEIYKPHLNTLAVYSN